MAPIPIVVFGRKAEIASKVREDMMPQYEVIHINLTPEQGAADLPYILSSPCVTPPSSSSNLGTRNYATRPFAVAIGGGFNDQVFQEIKNACKDVEQGITWVRADTSKWSSMPSLNDQDAFGAAMARRVKSKLNELGLGSGEEGNRREGYGYFR